MKNIVICCDGTGQDLGPSPTNVLRLYRLLTRDSRQLAYYDPGLGTISTAPIPTPLLGLLSKLLGFVCGYGLTQNVAEAYRFLMAKYEEGDQVFLFGFSRGAYTVRTLAKLLARCGLLPDGHEHLVPYALKLYRTPRPAPAQMFKERVARPCPVHFVGVWDTVRAIGLFGGLSLERVAVDPEIRVFRHALALDEQRPLFRLCRWTHSFQSGQDVQERWFPGDHSDVGGGHGVCELLANVTLNWISREAQSRGLHLVPGGLATYPPDVSNLGACPEAVHTRPRGLWRLLPHWPRSVPKHAILDDSVSALCRVRPGYRPPNLPCCALRRPPGTHP